MVFLSWSWELGCKVMTSRHVPLDRRIFDFRFLIWFSFSVFWFLISDFWFLISDFRFPISDFRFLISDFGFLISDCRLPFSAFGFRISDFGLRTSDFGFRISDSWFLISYFQSPDSWFLFSTIRKYLPSISGFWFMKFRKRIGRKASWLYRPHQNSPNESTGMKRDKSGTV